jgi:hypothetical protein
LRLSVISTVYYCWSIKTVFWREKLSSGLPSHFRLVGVCNGLLVQQHFTNCVPLNQSSISFCVSSFTYLSQFLFISLLLALAFQNFLLSFLYAFIARLFCSFLYIIIRYQSVAELKFWLVSKFSAHFSVCLSGV